MNRVLSKLLLYSPKEPEFVFLHDPGFCDLHNYFNFLFCKDQVIQNSGYANKLAIMSSKGQSSLRRSPNSKITKNLSAVKT